MKQVKDKKITFKLTSELNKRIEKHIEDSTIENKSQLIRLAIDSYLDGVTDNE